MKKFFKIATTSCLAICLFIGGMVVLSGCNNNKETELSYGTVTRDPSQVGGATLSFVYDEATHTATFGGEGQQVAYYAADASLGREAGNRVGIQITAPESVKDFSKATITMNGKTHENGSFLDGDNFVWVYPNLNENKKSETIKIRWQENTKEQVYTVKVAEGTTFAPASSALPASNRTDLNNNNYNNNNYNNGVYNNNNNNNTGVNQMYNGRNYNGYNRNFNRIRNNYNGYNRMNRTTPNTQNPTVTPSVNPSVTDNGTTTDGIVTNR